MPGILSPIELDQLRRAAQTSRIDEDLKAQRRQHIARESGYEVVQQSDGWIFVGLDDEVLGQPRATSREAWDDAYRYHMDHDSGLTPPAAGEESALRP